MNWVWLLLVVLVGLYLSFQYAWWRPTISYKHTRILMYHMISRQRPKAAFNKLRVDPAEFERQLKLLRKEGWSFLFMSQLGQTTQTKTVALTFDDGYRDNFLAAHALLEKYDAKATLYLVVDRHDRDWSTSKKLHHADGELKTEPKLLDKDVLIMLQSGRWELGGHTITHAHLNALDSRQSNVEIRDGKRMLEDQFLVSAPTFAYPFGIYSDHHVQQVEDAEYQYAVTTEQGITTRIEKDNLELKRVKVSGQDGLFSFRLRLRTGKCRWMD